MSFLDLPDLAALSKLDPYLALLVADPVLHLTRLRVVAPSRVDHSLFARSPQGTLLRPTIIDLAHRNVIRGHNIERKLRMGFYIYTPHVRILSPTHNTIPSHDVQSVNQYESGLRLQRERTGLIISSHLRRRAPPPVILKSLHHSHILPDVESSLLSVSRSLLPMVRKLKWSIQRDALANKVRGAKGSITGLGPWIELNGQSIVRDCERVRLALCPDVRRMVRFYDGLGH